MEVSDMFDVPVLAVLSITLCILLYWYNSRNFNFWKSRGVPYAKPYPFVGSMGSFLFKPFHTEEVKRYRKYGKVYGGFDGSHPYLSIGDPVLLKDVLVKDFSYFPNRRDMKTGFEIIDKSLVSQTGEEWKRIRNILTPVFTSGKLRKLYDIVNDSSITLRDHFTEEAKKGKPVDVTRLFGAFTMDVILSTAFGTKVDSLNAPDHPLVHMGKIMFRQSWRFFILFLFPALMKLFRIGAFSAEAAECFKEFTLNVIKERRESGKRREDFLQMLLDLADETSLQDGIEKDVKNSEAVKQSTKRGLTLDEIIAQCVIFISAGYDTTATTLSYVAYNLALNPHCYDRLAKEIDATYDKEGGLDYDEVQNMKYLDAVITETLRTHPAALRPDRQCAKDYKLGDTGITIPKGTTITVPIYAMHHNPEFFPEPEEFRPERFLPENKSNIIPYTYLPFGIGPRNCIGMRFALMEMKICLVNIIRHFRFTRCPETKVPGSFHSGILLIAPKSIDLQIEIRNHKKS